MAYSLIIFLAVFAMTAPAEAREYIVKKGDTYANIARRFYGEPVFGPKGSINTIYRLNPQARKNPALEPGTKLVLDDSLESRKEDHKDDKKEARKEHPVVAPVPVLPPKAELPAQPTIEDAKEAFSAEIAKVSEPLPIPPEVSKCPEAPACPVCPPAAPMPVETVQHESRATFGIIPKYSFISQKATESASGASVEVQSELAFGAELLWDQSWNDSFSTSLTYSFTQIRSVEKSGATGAPVFDGTALNRAELTLFNQFGSHVRAGFGVMYGDHVFIENLNESPSNPALYRISFFNPIVAAEIKAFDSKSFEAQLALKVALLPAQVGQGHDLKSGTEYGAQLSLVQKFTTWSLLYGVSYATEDQTRTGATETANELALKLGLLF